jgi:hypothetical protein
MSPTQLSKKHLTEQGYLPWITEHWNSFAKIRQDLFGFIDIIAVKEGSILGVQTTSKSNLSARVKKIKESEYLPIILSSGMRVIVHGWSKKKIGRKNVFELTQREIHGD